MYIFKVFNEDRTIFFQKEFYSKDDCQSFLDKYILENNINKTNKKTAIDISNDKTTFPLIKTLKDQENGRLVIAKIKEINERKNLDFVGLQALMSDPTMIFIERLLANQGSVSTALGIIRQLETDLFTKDEANEVISFIESLGYS